MTARRHPQAGTRPAHGPPYTFPAELRAQRTRRCWSQVALARRAGLTHGYISRLETGQRQPTRDSIIKIWTALESSFTMLDRLLISAGFLPTNPHLVGLMLHWLEMPAEEGAGH